MSFNCRPRFKSVIILFTLRGENCIHTLQVTEGVVVFNQPEQVLSQSAVTFTGVKLKVAKGAGLLRLHSHSKRFFFKDILSTCRLNSNNLIITYWQMKSCHCVNHKEHVTVFFLNFTNNTTWKTPKW